MNPPTVLSRAQYRTPRLSAFNPGGPEIMLIELEPAMPWGVERYWVTGGPDDFLDAANQYRAQHQGDAHALWVDDDNGKGTDGIRRVRLFCGCGQKRLLLGPHDGRPMRPIIPRLQ